jgi:hypothetical protein
MVALRFKVTLRAWEKASKIAELSTTAMDSLPRPQGYKGHRSKKVMAND